MCSLTRRSLSGVLLACWCVVLAACAPPEDPARAELRSRLTSPTQLSPDELTRFRTAVSRAIEGKSIRVRQDDATRELAPDQRSIVFGMLTDPAGLFDEGLRQDGGKALRMLNAPGISTNPEIEASRRLLIDIETLLPRRFEFFYAFQGYGDYSFDLIVE